MSSRGFFLFPWSSLALLTFVALSLSLTLSPGETNNNSNHTDCNIDTTATTFRLLGFFFFRCLPLEWTKTAVCASLLLHASTCDVLMDMPRHRPSIPSHLMRACNFTSPLSNNFPLYFSLRFWAESSRVESKGSIALIFSKPLDYVHFYCSVICLSSQLLLLPNVID